MRDLIEPIALMVTEPLLPLIPPSVVASLSANLSVIYEKPRPKVYLATTLLATIILLLTSLSGIFYQPLFLLAPAAIILFIIRILYPPYLRAEAARRIFEKMPSYLLSAASLIQAGQTPEEAFVQLSEKQRHKDISAIFLHTTQQSSRKRTELGQSLIAAISPFKSPELDRMALLLAAGITSGSNLHSLFNTVARDLLTIRELRQQQTQQMASLKYTLLLSGGILIPAILSYTLKVSTFVGSASASLLYASMISFLPLSIVLGTVIALFCDFQPKKSVIYIPLLLILQSLVFFIV